MLDELKEIEQIINKLDSVNPEDWKKRENETQEEFEERIKNIEEEIEEELIDVISDSLLNKQKIDEEEAVKEAREKIEKEYEIYQDAFEKDNNGKITLKSKEELLELGYEAEDEIEKLTTIMENYNDAEKYIGKIKKSINAQKNIDAEIERKMEIAKAYISAKIRGEEPVVPINEPKVKKYEENNNYILATSYLNRVPLVQNEMINNSRLIAKNYIPYTPRVQNNNPIQTKNSSTVSQITTNANIRPKTTSVNSVKVQVLRNIENKMDSTNDLSKQKIKARTELKMVLKEYENKKLDENELKLKIGNIEKKYPNIVTDVVLNKLYETFNIKLSVDKSKVIENKEEMQRQGNNANEPQQEQNEIVEPKEASNDTFDSKLLEFFGIDKIEDFNIENIATNTLYNAKVYIKRNNDSKRRATFNAIIEKINDFCGDEFIINTHKLDGYLEIKALEEMYQLYNNGLKSKDNETIIIEKDAQRAWKYLSNEFIYLQHLKQQAESKNSNPIENIKNEARFSQVIYDINRMSIYKKIDGLALMIEAEKLKRGNNSSNYKLFMDLFTSYEEKIKNGENIGLFALETLGDIYYNGILAKNGKDILKPDKLKAKSIYEKIIKEHQNDNSKITYNRLLELYNDNKLPIYDEKRAKEIEQIMEQKKIEKVTKLNTEEQTESSKPCTYVCSDLHGEYKAYETIIERIGDNDKLYIIGDVVDRGVDGIKILQDIIKRQEKGQVEFLMGNHEYMMLKSILGETKPEKLWDYNEKKTHEEYEKLSLDEQEKIKNFLMDAPMYKQIKEGGQDYYLVHAKAVQDAEEPSQTYRQMSSGKYKAMMNETVFSRAENKCEEEEIAKKGIFTIVGHTPTYGSRIAPHKGYVDIDCGISYGNNVSLINLTSGNVEYFSAEEIKETTKGKETTKEK